MRHALRALVFAVLCAGSVSAGVLDVPGAYPTIQSALDAAQDGDTVLVQPGTYGESLVISATSLTLESAAGAGATIVDATGLQARVMTITAGAGGVIVRGFTMTGGHLLDDQGAGVRADGPAPVTIENCIIRDNVADPHDFAFGGGVSAFAPTQLIACEIRSNQILGDNAFGGGVAGNLTATDCVLVGNSAAYGGGASGGTFVRCTFEGNVATNSGGGLYGLASGSATDCLFLNNVSGGGGGGCSLSGVGGLLGMVSLRRCTFLGNVAAVGGGGAALSASADMGGAVVSVINCVFAGNEAPFADGVSASVQSTTTGSVCIRFCTFVGDAVQGEDLVTVSHCIARDPPPGGPFVLPFGGTLSVAWSNVQGGWPGLGNFDADPLFVNPAAGDFHLAPGSPCIDAGDPAYVPTTPTFGCSFPGDDVDAQPRPMGGRVDVGADESEPDCNQNGVGDLADIAVGTSTDCDADHVPDECQPFTDCNGNGQFDACDIALGLSADCDSDGIPDECSVFRDCNANGIPDGCDIASGASADCDDDGVPDECQPPADCNRNGVSDACDIDAGTSTDCNGNGVPDECDIASGSSPDADGNGLPDECQAVLQVPADHATIQAAIDAAESGDTIRLADGTYTGPGFVALDFQGKELLLEATPGGCLIDCDGPRFARLGAAEAGGVRLRGLKIMFGTATSGGALLCEDGAVLDARDCVFEHNFATLNGGAAHVRNGASATFRGCAFLGNTAQNGGALRVTAATLLVEHGTFSNSSASSKGGAVSVAQGGTATLRDCILQLDSSPNGAELQADGAGSLITITYSDVLGGFLATNATAGAHLDWGAGMIDADPLIVDVPDDLHLQPGSPCINTGDPAGPQDADGSPPDMGALPYQTWTSLGGGIAGTFGLPELSANGPLLGGSLLRWSATHGWPGQAFSLVVGFAEAGVPFHGGVLWPVPHVLMGFAFDADGKASGAGHWPHAAPPGSGLWLQAWLADPGATGGLAASNGVRGIAP